MKQTLKTLALTTALSLAASLAQAAEAVTPPVGAVNFTCKPNSDTYISIPFSRAADFQGTISAAPSGSGATRTITVTGTPNFTANQFSNLWYVKFTSGPLDGRYYTVSSNTTSSVTININGDTTVDSAVAGNSFTIVKYWTVAELFPEGQTTITPVTSEFDPTEMELHIPDYTSDGFDLPNSKVLFPINDGASYYWYDSNAGAPAGDVILPPDGYIVIRSYQAAPTTFVSSGSVPMTKTVTPLYGRQSDLQDNPIGLARPKEVAIASLFDGSTFVETSSEFDSDGDQLLIWENNVVVGINQPASKVFVKIGGSWFDTIGGVFNDTYMIPVGAGLAIRKVNNGVPGGATTFITNSPNY